MDTQTSHIDTAARRSMAVLQFIFKDYHPRDFSIRLWDGSTWSAEPGQPSRFTMAIRHPGALRAMFLSGTEKALGEAYVRNEMDIEGSLEDAFPMAEYLMTLHPGIADRLRLGSLLLRLPSDHHSRAGRPEARPHGSLHSLERDRQAVTYHYNTSNDFFSLFLDRRMVYSCGYFSSPNEDLDSAQERKLEYTCRKLRLKPGQRLLDIGCGWGGLIMHAVKHHGVTAVGITLSEPQVRHANERIQAEGLGDRCRAEVRDYRQAGEPESFDALVSVGMVEHVGREKLPEYFRRAWHLLRPGGAFLNHGIGHAPGPRGAAAHSFTEAFVFPDSDPVPIGMVTEFAEEAGFEVRDVESLREHYALTLRHWVRRLEAHHEDAVRATDESTYRVWRLYMAGAARNFDRGLNNVYQSLLVKTAGGRSCLPLTRADWYA